MAGNWYNTNWKMRWPVAISNLGGGGGTGNVDVEIPIPSDWDDFWSNCNSNMFDVVPVDRFGNLIPFQRKAGSTYATKTLTLQLDNVPVNSLDANLLCYIYWFNTSATDQATPFAIGSIKAGNIFLGMPTGRIVQSLPSRATSEAPQTSFSKATNEEVDVWFSTKGLLSKRGSTYNQRDGFEDVDFVQIRSLDSSGVDDAGRYDEMETRFLPGWIKVRSKGGSNNTDYTLECKIVTTTSQIISLRTMIKVRDLLP